MRENKLLYSEGGINIGLLLLRIGIGIAFVMHGFPKLFVPQVQGYLAATFNKFGIPGGEISVYLAGGAEVIGGILLIIGLAFRPASILLAFTMAVALIWHIKQGHNFMKFSHSLESMILFVTLIFIGPGKLSLDAKFFGER